MAFKMPLLPNLRKRKRPEHLLQPPYKRLTEGLPYTDLMKINILSTIGRGSFGHVSLCKKGNDTLVLKELVVDDEDSHHLFAKEARLLHAMNHENIVKFDSICWDNRSCDNQVAFLMEYNCFDFSPLGHEFSVSSLQGFLSYIDNFNCEGFEHLNQHIVADICKGLCYLHSNDIAHRDLKPDNVLVSNQHYAKLDRGEREKFWASRPITAKLTDFGESRATLVQTRSVVHTATYNVQRGSPAYMAPEIYSFDGHSKMNMSDLKATDMWSFAMMMFIMMNPNFKWPYQTELKEEKARGNPKPCNELFRDMFSKKVLPQQGEKYKHLRATVWPKIMEGYTKCAQFNVRPTADEMLRFLEQEETQAANLEGEVVSVDSFAKDSDIGCIKKKGDGIYTPEGCGRKYSYSKEQGADQKVDVDFSARNSNMKCPEVKGDSIRKLDGCRRYYLKEKESDLKMDVDISAQDHDMKSLKVKGDSISILNDCKRKYSKEKESDQKAHAKDSNKKCGKVKGNSIIMLDGCRRKYSKEKEGDQKVHVKDSDNKGGKVKENSMNMLDSCIRKYSKEKESDLKMDVDISVENRDRKCHEVKEDSISILDDCKRRYSKEKESDQKAHVKDSDNKGGKVKGNSIIMLDGCRRKYSKEKEGDQKVHVKDSDNKGGKVKENSMNMLDGCIRKYSKEKESDLKMDVDISVEDRDRKCHEVKGDSINILDDFKRRYSKEKESDQKAHVKDSDNKGGKVKGNSIIMLDGPRRKYSKEKEGDQKVHVKDSDNKGGKVKGNSMNMLDGCRRKFSKEKEGERKVHVKDSDNKGGKVKGNGMNMLDGCRRKYSKEKEGERKVHVKDSHNKGGKVKGNSMNMLVNFPSKDHDMKCPEIKRDNISMSDVCKRDSFKDKEPHLASVADETVDDFNDFSPDEMDLLECAPNSYDTQPDKPCRAPHAGPSELSYDKKPKPKYFNDQTELPVYFYGKTERFTPIEAVNILMAENDMCTKVPLRVRQNCAFVVNTKTLSSIEDIKADMNGTYQRLLRVGTWTVAIELDTAAVRILDRKKVAIDSEANHVYHLSINSKMNHAGLARSIYMLMDKHGQIFNDACLLQYHIDQSLGQNQLEFDVLPHGNRRHGITPFQPTQKSTLTEMKSALREGNNSAVVYNKLSKSEGGIMKVSHPGQIPRSRQQVYNMKGHLNKYDEVEELILYAQTKEDEIVIEHQDLPEDLWVLGTNQMCKDMQRFCNTGNAYYPVSVDPTFEFGQFEVTPFTYRHPLLKSKRSGVSPIFLGPTAIHSSKDSTTYGKIVSSISRRCPRLKTDMVGFVTDGEAALYNALHDNFPLATGMRCVRHFHGNCKKKLNAIGIRRDCEQKFFLECVFGKNGNGGLIDSSDSEELSARIQSLEELLGTHEGNIFNTSEGYTSKFWKYIKKNENMIAQHMITCQRMKAGMPLDQKGQPCRPYTNQSESLNNILTRQKEAILKEPKKKVHTNKLFFVKHVWEEVANHQITETGRAICGMSEEYCLTEKTSYLLVKQEEWFSWSSSQREFYMERFNSMTLDDVIVKKSIKIPHDASVKNLTAPQLFECGIKDELQTVADISRDIAETLITETELLLKSPSAVSTMPSFSHDNIKKFLVASKALKRGFYVCMMYKDHVCCDCPAFKYQMICKHSLCVAQKNSITTSHLAFIGKQKPTKKRGKLLKPPKDAAGKKGGQHKNPWRQRNALSISEPVGDPENAGSLFTERPFSEIHHNNLPLEIRFLIDEPKALQCRHCGVEFPRYQLVRPFDIVIGHKEKWSYPSKGKRCVSSKYTTKFYCVQAGCIIGRFEYFHVSLLKVDSDTKKRLCPSHKELLKHELNFEL